MPLLILNSKKTKPEIISVPQGSSTNSSMLTASSYYSASYKPSKAFNGIATSGSMTDCWISREENGPSPDGSCWIQWNFEAQCIVTKFRFSTRNWNVYNYPKNVAVKVSNTGAFSGEETVVRTYTFGTVGRDRFSEWVIFNNPIAGQYLRIEIHSGVYHESRFFVCIQEVEFSDI